MLSSSDQSSALYLSLETSHVAINCLESWRIIDHPRLSLCYLFLWPQLKLSTVHSPSSLQPQACTSIAASLHVAVACSPRKWRSWPSQTLSFMYQILPTPVTRGGSSASLAGRAVSAHIWPMRCGVGQCTVTTYIIVLNILRSTSMSLRPCGQLRCSVF